MSLNLLDGGLGLDQGAIRLTNLKTNDVFYLTEYAATLSAEISERPVSEDQTGAGALVNVGRKPADKLTIKIFFTKGETSAAHGDVYRDDIHPISQEKDNKVLVEWTKDSAETAFAAGSTGWSTSIESGRIYHADVPSIDFGSSSNTPIEIKVITPLIKPVTFS